MRAPVYFALYFASADVAERRAAAEQRLAHTDPSDHVARAELHAIVAAASLFTDPEVAIEAANQASYEAALTDDEVALGWALIAECVVDLSCDATESRLTKAATVLRIAHDTGETGFLSTAYMLHLAALAELGRVEELGHALSPVGPMLLKFPVLEEGRQVAWFRCLQATIDGQLDLAEHLARRAYAIAQASGDPDSASVFLGQMGIIRWAQGRVVDLEPDFLQARQLAPHEPVWGVSLAWIWLKQGRRSAARALVSSLPPIPDLPIDRNWLSTACILADVTSELRELAIVRQLHELLLPYRDRLATIGFGVTCWGTVARALALTAAALGHTDEAVDHYRNAIEVASRSGAHAWLAEAQWELATLLAQRSRPGDLDEAVSLASEAAAAGRALRLRGIEGSATQVLASIQTTDQPVNVAEPTLAEPARPRIAVFDGFEVTSADGDVAHWQSRKARQLLKILVARRGSAVGRETVMEMLWPGEHPERVANRFSVAVTTIRRALDPAGDQPRNAYIDNRDGLIRLRVEAIDIDVERFLVDAHAAIVSSAPAEDKQELLTQAMALYTGDPLHEEQEELWADELRREVHLAFFAVGHTLAELLKDLGDHLARLETYRRILALDEYDQRAHEGVIDALQQLGSHGKAESARAEYFQRMDELGVPHA